MSDGMTEFGKALEHIRRCLFWDFAGDRLLNELQTPLGRDYFDRLMEGLTEAHDADVAKYDAENAKLRELVKKLVILAFARCADCDLFDASCALAPTQKCLLWNECESIARELGVDE